MRERLDPDGMGPEHQPPYLAHYSRRLPTVEPDRLRFERPFDSLAGLGLVLCNSL
jgi:hypothetical protein